ncbi:MAG: 1-deoxy-D-xylulose-5-phosphate reductoisomerase, partial [Thermaurantiacus sp.]
VRRLDLASIGRLDFEEPDRVRFPALRLAETALAQGDCRPCVLNAANEVAVAAFLDGRIGFLDIAAVVEDTLQALPRFGLTCLDAVTAADAKARESARSFAGHRTRR